MTTRLSMSSLAGTARTLVAVGTCERGLHVGHDAGGGATQRLDLGLADRAGALEAGGLARGGLLGGLRGLDLRLGPGLAVSRGAATLAAAACPPTAASLSSGLSATALSVAASGLSVVLACFCTVAGALAPCPLAPCRRLGGGLGGRCLGWRGGAVDGGLPGAVVLEELPPGLVHGVLVLEVLLVQLVHEPLVGPEGSHGVVGRGLVRHGGYASFIASTVTKQTGTPSLSPCCSTRPGGLTPFCGRSVTRARRPPDTSKGCQTGPPERPESGSAPSRAGCRAV